jgi:triacylglycerol lipase
MIRTIFNETQSSARCALFQLERMRKLPSPQPKQGFRPVLLVHGFMGNQYMMYPIARRLLLAGVPAVVIAEYSSWTCTLEQIIDHLEQRVASEPTEYAEWDVIGHSLGAIALRAWFKTRETAPPVRKFIALGPPFQGTGWFRIVPEVLREVFEPDGPWVKRLATGPEPVATHIIRARHDQNIRPSSSSSLPGAQQTILETIGHNGLLNHRTAIDAILDALVKL